MLSKKRTIKQLLIWRLGEILLVLILVGIIAALSVRIQGVRRDILEKRLTLEQNLGDIGHTAELKEELLGRQHDINRIKAFVPERQALGEVVGALERAADQMGLVLAVPEVKEEIKLDEEGEPIPPAGPLQQARLELVATGEPEAVLRWLHAVEHQPYLITVVDWSFGTELVSKLSQGGSGRGPDTGPGGAPEVRKVERRVATLRAEVLVSILVNEDVDED